MGSVTLPLVVDVSRMSKVDQFWMSECRYQIPVHNFEDF